MTASGTFHQANEEQSDSSMMAWRVHEFGPPNAKSLEAGGQFRRLHPK